jgi:hypothetical protein
MATPHRHPATAATEPLAPELRHSPGGRAWGGDATACHAHRHRLPAARQLRSAVRRPAVHAPGLPGLPAVRRHHLPRGRPQPGRPRTSAQRSRAGVRRGAAQPSQRRPELPDGGRRRRLRGTGCSCLHREGLPSDVPPGGRRPWWAEVLRGPRGPGARSGADVFDLAGKVRSIGVNSGFDGTTELAAIKERKRVATLMKAVLTAPVRSTHMSEGESCILAFHLVDRTAVTRGFQLATGRLDPGVFVPSSFSRSVAAALRAAHRSCSEQP